MNVRRRTPSTRSQKFLELPVDRPREERLRSPADVLEALTCSCLRRLEAIYLVELPTPLVDQRRETLYLVVCGEPLGLRPGVVASSTGCFVGVLRTDHRLLLLRADELGLPQLALQGLYRRGHKKPFPLLTNRSSAPAFYSNSKRATVEKRSAYCT